MDTKFSISDSESEPSEEVEESETDQLYYTTQEQNSPLGHNLTAPELRMAENLESSILKSHQAHQEMQRKNQKARKNYLSEKEAFRDKAQRTAALAMTEAKQQVWEEFREAMENDFQSAPKCFWKTVQHLRWGKQGTIQAVHTSGRIRLNSESQASAVSRDEALQAREESEETLTGDGAPFRARSQSAPPALWAAKKYGRQLRRMSDEFDSMLDKGGMRKVKSAGTAQQMQHSKSWWSYLFSHQESDGENSHHENHSNRTE